MGGSAGKECDQRGISNGSHSRRAGGAGIRGAQAGALRGAEAVGSLKSGGHARENHPGRKHQGTGGGTAEEITTRMHWNRANACKSCATRGAKI